MRLTMIGLLCDAWRLWRRDSALLLPVAGFFLCLPNLMLYLMVPPAPAQPPEADTTEQRVAYLRAILDWAMAHGGWFIAAAIITYFGVLTLMALYLHPLRPDLRAALGEAARLFPRYLLAMLIIGLPVAIGWTIFLAPGIFLLARWAMIGPTMVAEVKVSAAGAITRSWRVTRGHSFALMGVVSATLLAGILLAEPFLSAERMMRAANAENPIAVSILCIGAALGSGFATLGGALCQIAAWRRLTA